MSERLEVLAVIGVRSGSKGLPDKNVLPLKGHPLLAWIVSAALRAERVTRVIVSTDDARYARIAREYGAETPFLRPASLASDASPDVDYVHHALRQLEASEGYVPDVVLRLLATVPTQTPEDLDAVVDVLLADPLATSAVVVTEARQHPEKTMRILEFEGHRRLAPYLADRDGVEPTARQAYAPAFVRANVVATRPEVVFTTGTLTGGEVACHVVERERIIDIDDALDLEIAAMLIERYRRIVATPVRALPSSRDADEDARSDPEEGPE
jgi:CMP-N,N'-diacetyllegionaminic acid synthase